MSDDEKMIPRWTIQPDPTAEELVAILAAMHWGARIETPPEQTSESRWSQTARREQLRAPLDEPGNGWKR